MATSKKKTPASAWKPGQSGNPAGKPSGCGELQKLRAAIGEHIPEIIRQLVELARGGDIQAARLILERVLPPMKAIEQPQTIELPDGTLTDQGRAILRSVACGELAPGQGAQLLAAIGTLAKVTEIDELEKRITQLESNKGAQHGNT